MRALIWLYIGCSDSNHEPRVDLSRLYPLAHMGANIFKVKYRVDMTAPRALIAGRPRMML